MIITTTIRLICAQSSACQADGLEQQQARRESEQRERQEPRQCRRRIEERIHDTGGRTLEGAHDVEAVGTEAAIEGCVGGIIK
jgi:hypothetical protein